MRVEWTKTAEPYSGTVKRVHGNRIEVEYDGTSDFEMLNLELHGDLKRIVWADCKSCSSGATQHWCKDKVVGVQRGD